MELVDQKLAIKKFTHKILFLLFLAECRSSAFPPCSFSCPVSFRPVYLVFAEVVSEVVSRTSGIVSTVFHFCFLVVDFSGRAWLVAGLDGDGDGSVSGLARGRRDPPSSLFRTRFGWFEWCRRSLDRVTFDTWFRRPSCLLINVHVVSLMVMSSVLIWRLRSITVRSRLRTTKCEMVVGGRPVVSAVTVLLCRLSARFFGVITRFCRSARFLTFSARQAR